MLHAYGHSNAHALQDDLILLPLLLLATELDPQLSNGSRQRLEKLLLGQVGAQETASRKRKNEQSEVDTHPGELHQVRKPGRWIEQNVRTDGEGDKHRNDERQVLRHALSEWRADAEHDGGKDVLVTG